MQVGVYVDVNKNINLHICREESQDFYLSVTYLTSAGHAQSSMNSPTDPTLSFLNGFPILLDLF